MKAVDSIAEDLNSKNEDMDHFFQRFILWKSLNQIQCLKLENLGKSSLLKQQQAKG